MAPRWPTSFCGARSWQLRGGRAWAEGAGRTAALGCSAGTVLKRMGPWGWRCVGSWGWRCEGSCGAMRPGCNVARRCWGGCRWRSGLKRGVRLPASLQPYVLFIFIQANASFRRMTSTHSHCTFSAKSCLHLLLLHLLPLPLPLPMPLPLRLSSCLSQSTRLARLVRLRLLLRCCSFAMKWAACRVQSTLRTGAVSRQIY